VSGWFFTQGWHTWNTSKQIDTFMANMKKWCDRATRPKSCVVVPDDDDDDDDSVSTKT
jgi:hypothetical protein